MEINSIHPVILTWVKVNPDKKLEELPNFTIQMFEREEKLVKFVQSESLGTDGCRVVAKEEWKQEWCLRPKSILILLSKNVDTESSGIEKDLKKWILTHD